MSSSRSTCRSFPTGVRRRALYAPGQWWATRAYAWETQVVHWSANKAPDGSSMASAAIFIAALTRVIRQVSPTLRISCHGSNSKLEVSGCVFIACCHLAHASAPLRWTWVARSEYRTTYRVRTSDVGGGKWKWRIIGGTINNIRTAEGPKWRCGSAVRSTSGIWGETPTAQPFFLYFRCSIGEGSPRRNIFPNQRLYWVIWLPWVNCSYNIIVIYIHNHSAVISCRRRIHVFGTIYFNMR